MPAPRSIEVFTADCPLCADAVDLVRRLAGPDDTVALRPLQDEAAATEAGRLGA
jgi:predicted DCC family thiol-disulfide oxidoreductase YuxK